MDLSSTESMVASLPLLTVALAVWLVEMRKRGTSTATGKSNWIQNCAAELVAFATCSSLIITLIIRGEHLGAPIPEGNKEWAEITNEWPTLMTADTLLGAQALLRVVFLASAALRAGPQSAMPLTPEPAAFMLFAQLARAALLILSPLDCYHIDGPLGGKLNIVAEFAAIPLLLYLSSGMVQRGLQNWSLLVVGLLVSGTAATFNQLNMADPKEVPLHLDELWSGIHMLECCGAASFLVLTICMSDEARKMRNEAFANIAHLFLPVQQILAAFFLLTAFQSPSDPPLTIPPALVRVGYPFHLLWISSCASVGFYLFAGALHFGSCFEIEENPATEVLV